MILDAMRRIDAEGMSMSRADGFLHGADLRHSLTSTGVAILDCHPDLEVFRQRIGKAINFEYFEDSQTGLFQRRDPREGGPALDIERGASY